ncbi:MAG: SH3 domain-containing protein [Burkholderiales bacterium]|nr:SH3 domain-containing protein [Anaerolineae bacterium]
MTKLRSITLVVMAALALIVGILPGYAQTPEGTPVIPAQSLIVEPIGAPANQFVNLTWPPPVYVVRGQVTLRGSANLPQMNNYFIEFRALNPDLTPNENGTWLPAILPQQSSVQDAELGVWDTTLVPDGVYEIRLTVNVTGVAPVFARVSPVRVENNPPPFVIIATPIPTQAPQPTQAPVFSTPTIIAPPPPTQAPAPTQIPPTPVDTTPRVTANLNANVRDGDTTEYPVLDFLLNGDVARIIGISARGNGWYLIQMENGTRGWISPTVVTVEGDLNAVPRVQPPPPPFTPTPSPTLTPVTQANIIITGITLDEDPPECNNTFTIRVGVKNIGSGSSNSTGTLSSQDFHIASNTVQGSTTGGFPVLAPNQEFTVELRLTVATYYNEAHRIVIVADSANQVPETNEGDNFAARDYTLARATC